MTPLLLATKLQTPPLRPQLVPRTHLIERLADGLHRHCRLSLVSAPAGFGKTTVLSSWISGSRLSCAWLSLDSSDNDPAQFLRYLIAALQQVDPAIGQAVLPLLQAAQLPPPQSILTALLNDCADRSEKLVLVLDDYHLLVEPAVHQLVAFLLEHMPPMLQLAIGTREDPPLPLPRLRARGQVVEIRQRDLRFTPEEALTFLRETMRLPLTPSGAATLQARTEGWPTGLQLAALALQQAPEQAEQFIAAFAGDDRYVMDYLMDEVLERVPAPVREFLHQTAILDRFSASLCDAVTGRDDSRALLDTLESANLFVIALDNRREWYRYHELFAAVLRLAHDCEAHPALHGRAAAWYREHDMAEQAIMHGLRQAQLNGDYAQVEQWIAEASMPTLANGALATVRGWLSSLPEQDLCARPELALAQGWVLVLSGNLPLAETYAEVARAAARPEEPAALRAKALLLSSMIALLGHKDYPRAIRQIDEVLALLPDDRAYWRLIALWIKAESAERIGPITRAIEAFGDAQAAGHSVGNHVFLITVEMALVGALNQHGQRQEALRVCTQALARHTDPGGHVAPLAAPILSQLGALYYEANQLDRARQAHDQALAFSMQLALSPYQIPSYGLRAPTYYALGAIDDALEGLRIALQLVGETGLSETSWLAAREADIRMRQGHLAAAVRWAETARLSSGDSQLHYLEIDSYLVYARILIAQGNLEDAAQLLKRLSDFLQGYELYRPLLTVMLMQALVESRLGQHAAALALTEAAVQLAAPETYYRAFLDEEPALLELLREVRQSAPAFVDQVLEWAARQDSAEPVALQPLIEPLSERELEVLALMAEGCSNAEIAERLVIAVGTVKRHINNMYGKLEVQSRTQAIAKARGLHLLEYIST